MFLVPYIVNANCMLAQILQERRICSQSLSIRSRPMFYPRCVAILSIKYALKDECKTEQLETASNLANEFMQIDGRTNNGLGLVKRQTLND